MAGSGLKTRRLTCWIESFIDATSGLPSPEIFRKWVAIATIAGALERRVFAESSMSRVYPNLYVLLVAPPGVGKSVAIFQGLSLWNKTKKLKVAPDDITKAALIDHLHRAEQTKVYGPTEMLQYHSLQIAADEFGVLVPSHDSGFLSTMNALFDNRDNFTESRRGRENDLVIQNPQVNMLAGTQPDFLANLLPPEAWGMGFMSRMLMVYAGKSARPKLFGKRLKIDTTDLLADLKVICELHGEMEWAPSAETTLVDWYETGMAPEPEHSKLKHYVPRRILTMLKLSIISAASRGNAMIIESIDVERARDWLLEIEVFMPDIFKDMNGQSDIQVMQDLHFYMWQLYGAEKSAVHVTILERFLDARTPAWNVEHIIKAMTRSGMIIEDKTQLGDFFIPGAKNTLGNE